MFRIFVVLVLILPVRSFAGELADAARESMLRGLIDIPAAAAGFLTGQGLPAGPQWVRVPPKSKEECFRQSQDVINPVFMHCRNGFDALVQTDALGRVRVLSIRPMGTH